MNIHLPAILMWTTGVQGFDTLPYRFEFDHIDLRHRGNVLQPGASGLTSRDVLMDLFIFFSMASKTQQKV